MKGENIADIPERILMIKLLFSIGRLILSHRIRAKPEPFAITKLFDTLWSFLKLFYFVFFYCV